MQSEDIEQVIKKYLEQIERVDFDFAAEAVCKRIRKVMEATHYPQKYFTKEDSDFQETISSHMKKEKGYSEASVIKFLQGEFGTKNKQKQFTEFLTGAVIYFNLQNDIAYLFDINSNTEELLAVFRERWQERNKAYERLLTRMEPAGELFRKKIGDARKISVLGISLHNTVSNHGKEIEKSLKKQCELRMIIINPLSSAIFECSFRSSKGLSEKTYVEEIEKTLGIVKNWHQKRYNIKVMLIDHLPSYAMTIIEPTSKNEKIHCHVRMFPFRSTSLKGPSINPDAVIHKEWFNFFCEQYEEIWKAGKVWKPVE